MLSEADSGQEALNAIIDWRTGTGTDIEIPEETDEAISLNSCVTLCKAFRDTIKGPLAIMDSKIKELENKKSSEILESDELDTVKGYPKYSATNDTVVMDTWNGDNTKGYHSLRFKYLMS